MEARTPYPLQRILKKSLQSSAGRLRYCSSPWSRSGVARLKAKSPASRWFPARWRRYYYFLSSLQCNIKVPNLDMGVWRLRFLFARRSHQVLSATVVLACSNFRRYCWRGGDVFVIRLARGVSVVIFPPWLQLRQSKK